MTHTAHHVAGDTAVRPMVFSHASADQPVTSPALGYVDNETRNTLFSADATARVRQPRP